jgi:CheY-like chemotaxis protein
MVSQSAQSGQRILVADDDAVIRHMVAAILRDDGHEAVEVCDGLEAYRILLRDANFKAAIFDKMMPRLGGLDVVRRMRREKRLMRIPVIMITSENDLKLMKESFEAGVTVFLPKPFSPVQLQTILQAVLVSKQRATVLQH